MKAQFPFFHFFFFFSLCLLYLIGFSLYAEPDVYKEVKQKLDLGSVKFEVIHAVLI